MRAHTYVIAVDAGSAPNYEPPLVTLAVCKPRIRRKASLGELVIAFAGKGVNFHEPHAVVWAGIVLEKLTFAQYWDDKRFRNKRPDRSRYPDNFYKPAGGALVWVDNDVHEPEAASHDTGGQFVLTFSPAWTFGAHGPVLPSDFGLRMIRGRRAERMVDLTNDVWLRLKSWLDEQANGSVPGEQTGKSCGPRSPHVARRRRKKPMRGC